jgi:hypothetical protein
LLDVLARVQRSASAAKRPNGTFYFVEGVYIQQGAREPHTAQKIKEIPRVKYTTKKYARKIHRKYTQPGNTPKNTPPGLENTRGFFFFELQRTCILHTAGSAKPAERSAVVVV